MTLMEMNEHVLIFFNRLNIFAIFVVKMPAPVLMYVRQTWVVSKNQQQRIVTCEMSFLEKGFVEG